MVGSLTPYHKGQDLVIEVLSRPRWRERPLRVDLYGEGSAHTTLQRRIDQLGLDKVAFKGFEPDKAVIWGGHQAALFASRMEGRSLALQEAMAHARMVISTDVGGARDLIDHGTNGFLVPYASVEALDKVLEEAWQDRARWEAMGQAARQRILGAIGKDPALRFAEAIESAFSGTAQPFGLGYSKNRRT
jgi:glycosyltransferase involved in cell wall biosynthesis